MTTGQKEPPRLISPPETPTPRKKYEGQVKISVWEGKNPEEPTAFSLTDLTWKRRKEEQVDG